MGLFDKLLGKKKETPQGQLIPWEEILLRGGTSTKRRPGLADPSHPARKWIDEASAIANDARVAADQDGKTVVEAIPPQFIAAINNALERSPDDVDLLVAKSAALFWFGEFKDAQQIIDKALSLEPGHFEARRPKEPLGETL